MGFKSLAQSKNTQYKVDGLIFPSKERYQDLKGIDIGVDIILSDLDNEEEFKAFFDIKLFKSILSQKKQKVEFKK